MLAQVETIPRTTQKADLVLRSRPLCIEDIEFVKALGKIEGDTLFIERSPKQYQLKTPVSVPVSKVLALGQRGLAQYILQSLTANRPRLIPLVLENRSLVELANHLLRRYSGSAMSLYAYCNTVAQYAKNLGHTPDGLIADAKRGPRRVLAHQKAIEEAIANLQDLGKITGTSTRLCKAAQNMVPMQRHRVEADIGSTSEDDLQGQGPYATGAFSAAGRG